MVLHLNLLKNKNIFYERYQKRLVINLLTFLFNIIKLNSEEVIVFKNNSVFLIKIGRNFFKWFVIYMNTKS